MRLRLWLPSFACFLLGLFLCFGLLLWLQTEANDWGILLHGFSMPWAAVFLVLTALLMIIGARKWALMSQALHQAAEPTVGFFLRHYLWQNWVGQFVMPSLTIILGRGLAAKSMAGVSKRSGSWSGLLDQAMEFGLLLALLPGTALVVCNGWGWSGFFFGSFVGLSFAAVLAEIVCRKIIPSLHAVFWPLFGWSFLRISLTLLRLLVGVKALGLSLSLLAVTAVAPFVSLVGVVPFTPANLGLAEWGWVGGLAYAGQSARDAALYAIGFRLLVLVAQTLLLGLNEAYVHFGKKASAL